MQQFFNLFKRRTGIKCSFKRWFRVFDKTMFLQKFRVHRRKPKGWYLTLKQFEKCLASLDVFFRFKSILLRPTHFFPSRIRSSLKREGKVSPYVQFSQLQARAFIRQKNLKLKAFNN